MWRVPWYSCLIGLQKEQGPCQRAGCACRPQGSRGQGAEGVEGWAVRLERELTGPGLGGLGLDAW